jgi:coproporphyrinogen III oxidase
MVYHPNTGLFNSFLKQAQADLCGAIEQEDGHKRFKADEWSYSGGQGGGCSCVLSGGQLFEKAGVNVSSISGIQLPKAASAHRDIPDNTAFQAMGISTVIHPLNPYVPTAHANVRWLCPMGKEEGFGWFGGGCDLTPYYPFFEDCVAWHRAMKAPCDKFHPEAYQNYKRQCDEYFYLPHRKETRGVGGIFFDDLKTASWETGFQFLQDVFQAFISGYIEIIQRRKGMDYGAEERDFQLHRRGRYVEFNLLYDRGTLFGLQSNGRTESILMSLPECVKWTYGYTPKEGSKEAELTAYLKPREWLSAQTLQVE